MGKIRQCQDRDAAVVDYQLFELPELEYALRGPKPASLKPGRFASIIGAAQSFGVLARRPFAYRLEEVTGLPFLNLAVSGASPPLYLENPSYIDYANRSLFAIVQVMGARASSNSYFETRHGKNMMRPRGSTLPFIPGDAAFRKMMEYEPEALVAAVTGELRANWTKEMIQLLTRIKVPKILLWISKRKPDYAESFDRFENLAGVFPQFVNSRMIEEIRDFADAYVEVTSNRGMPHRLTSKDTGEPVAIDAAPGRPGRTEENYFPSPEIHEDVFLATLPAIETIIAGLERRHASTAGTARSGQARRLEGVE
jgi:hypothetical protein